MTTLNETIVTIERLRSELPDGCRSDWAAAHDWEWESSPIAYVHPASEGKREGHNAILTTTDGDFRGVEKGDHEGRAKNYDRAGQAITRYVAAIHNAVPALVADNQSLARRNESLMAAIGQALSELSVLPAPRALAHVEAILTAAAYSADDQVQQKEKIQMTSVVQKAPVATATEWDAWNAAQAEGRPEDRVELTDRVIELFRELRLPAGARVLDVGVGAGFTTDALSYRYRYVGIDMSSAGIERARARNPGAELHTRDFLSWPLPEYEFDAAICVDTIACIDDQEGAVAKIADALRPGAGLVMTTVNPLVYERLGWIRARGGARMSAWLTGAEFVALLQRHRFAVDSLKTIVPAGDRGWLRALNSRRLKAAGGKGYVRALEAIGLGQYQVAVARKL